MNVSIIETSGLGDRSYLVSDGDVAVVIDPQRDIDRVFNLVRERGVRITHVLETHIHNDYVTGGLELSRVARRRIRRPRRRRRRLPAPRHRRRRRHRRRAVPAAGHPHPRSHPPPRQLRTARPQRHDRRCVHRRIHAARHHRTHRPARRRTHPGPDPRSVPLGASPRRRTAGRHAGLSHPWLRQLLLGHPGQRRLVDHRRATPEQSGTDPGRADLRRRTASPACPPTPPTTPTWASSTSEDPPPSTCRCPQPVDPDELRRRIDAGEWVVDLRNRTAFAAGHLDGTLRFRVVELLRHLPRAGSTPGVPR